MIENLMEITKKDDKNSKADFGVVSAVHADGVQLIFDGETAAAQKHYQVLQSYKPKVGDRVYLVRVSGTAVVLGSVGAPMSESGGGSSSNEFDTLTVNGAATLKNTLVVTGDTTINGGLTVNGTNTSVNYLTVDNDLRVSGKLGLFGTSPVSKTSIAQMASRVTGQTAGSTYTSTERTMLNNLKTDINTTYLKLWDLINALRAIGII